MSPPALDCGYNITSSLKFLHVASPVMNCYQKLWVEKTLTPQVDFYSTCHHSNRNETKPVKKEEVWKADSVSRRNQCPEECSVKSVSILGMAFSMSTLAIFFTRRSSSVSTGGWYQSVDNAPGDSFGCKQHSSPASVSVLTCRLLPGVPAWHPSVTTMTWWVIRWGKTPHHHYHLGSAQCLSQQQRRWAKMGQWDWKSLETSWSPKPHQWLTVFRDLPVGWDLMATDHSRGDELPSA